MSVTAVSPAAAAVDEVEASRQLILRQQQELSAQMQQFQFQQQQARSQMAAQWQQMQQAQMQAMTGGNFPVPGMPSVMDPQPPQPFELSQEAMMAAQAELTQLASDTATPSDETWVVTPTKDRGA